MKKLKPILVLALVFVAGIIVGVTATRVVTQRVIRRAITHPEFVRDHIESDLTRKLKLDARQRDKLHAGLLDVQRQIGELRQEFQPRFAAIITNGQARLSAELTDEQRAKFDKIKESHRRFFQP